MKPKRREKQMPAVAPIVNKFAEKNNIIAGICDAAPLDSARLLTFTPFVSGDIAKRADPQATLRGAQSIIVIGARHSSTVTHENGTVPLSSLGANDDYHIKVKKILRDLVEELKISYENFKYKALVDSPGLDERALAYRAGLGFFGRNGLIISEKFGSRFNIGCLLTDIPFSPSEKTTRSCPPHCNLCIDACPTAALSAAGFQAARCISYLTQKDELSPDEEKLIAGHLFGCDICQDACPFNEKKQAVFVNPEDWLAMDDDAFQKKYGNTAMLWRGTDILRRNAGLRNGGQ
jgi:epoxyqueuosine reductase